LNASSQDCGANSSPRKRRNYSISSIFISADEPGCSYAEIATRTGLKEGTVKVAVHRLRRRYDEMLREEISNTVSEPGEVEAELRHLILVLGR